MTLKNEKCRRSACIMVPGTYSWSQASWLGRPHNSVELMWSHHVGSALVRRRVGVRCSASCRIGMWCIRLTRCLQWTLALGIWNVTLLVRKEPGLMYELENYWVIIAGHTPSHNKGTSIKLLHQEFVTLLPLVVGLSLVWAYSTVPG